MFEPKKSNRRRLGRKSLASDTKNHRLTASDNDVQLRQAFRELFATNVRITATHRIVRFVRCSCSSIKNLPNGAYRVPVRTHFHYQQASDAACALRLFSVVCPTVKLRGRAITKRSISLMTSPVAKQDKQW